MPRELDNYATLHLRLTRTLRHLTTLADDLGYTALRAPNSYQGQPLLSAALLDLRDVERRLNIALSKTPNDEQEAGKL